MSSSWCVYILVTDDLQYSYCGASINFDHRFRQHCGIIKGGARYTTNLTKAGYTWRPLVVITGFADQKQALQMELCQKEKMAKWRNGHLDATKKALIGTLTNLKHKRIKILAQTLLLSNWTSRAIDADTVTLNLYWYDAADIPHGWENVMPNHLKTTCQNEWGSRLRQ